MKKALAATNVEFESSSNKTPEYLAWHRLFKKEFTNFLIGFSQATNIQISKPNHFDMSGFFTVDNQIWYFSIADIRRSKDNMLLRTAKSYKDYTGGTNNFISLKNELDFAFEFRKIVHSNFKSI